MIIEKSGNFKGVIDIFYAKKTSLLFLDRMLTAGTAIF